MPVVLVVTTVHPADDPRIRVRTVGVLAQAMPVRYAGRAPAPVADTDVEWRPLHGSRLVRDLRALREMLRPDVGVVSVHDPELLPLALVARLRGKGVVFDVHEDVPAQLRHKDWLARPLRRPLAAGVALLLRAAERVVAITLAEENYARLFRNAHPVFPNYPLADDLPPPGDVMGDAVVYVGDITEARGAELIVRAVAGMVRPLALDMVGRCREPLRSRLITLARDLDVDLRLPGFLPHTEAMARAVKGAVGVSPLLGLPNHRDSLPTKVIEYLALGLPVVASDLPGTRRIVGQLPGVQLVPAGDVGAWTVALERAVEDPGLRAAARAAADDVRRRFTWAAADLRALYRDLLDDVTR